MGAVLSSDGGMIVLTYDEVLDNANTPTSSNFAVTVDEQSAALSSSIAGDVLADARWPWAWTAR